jgi:hypothetical protein
MCGTTAWEGDIGGDAILESSLSSMGMGLDITEEGGGGGGGGAEMGRIGTGAGGGGI